MKQILKGSSLIGLLIQLISKMKLRRSTSLVRTKSYGSQKYTGKDKNDFILTQKEKIMRNFEDYLRVILKHEGGFVDHPNDPGGATNLGISMRFLVQLGDYDNDGYLEGDIDRDGDIDVDDIRAMTPEDAAKFYHEHFWKKMRCDEINDEMLRLHIFDNGVNCGAIRAIKMIQVLVGVTDDGNIGPITLAAINARTKYPIWKVYEDVELPVLLWQEYAWARIQRYRYLATRNEKLAIFLKGWERRVHSTCIEL